MIVILAAFVVISAGGCLAMVLLFPRHARREHHREDVASDSRDQHPNV